MIIYLCILAICILVRVMSNINPLPPTCYSRPVFRSVNSSDPDVTPINSTTHLDPTCLTNSQDFLKKRVCDVFKTVTYKYTRF